MKIGILGLPGSGKTTIWCLLTESLDGPDPAMAGRLQLRTVKVHDPRLERLRDDYHPKKYTPATVELGDFPALGAAAGGAELAKKDRASLANLLAPARNMDALIVVLRAFEDPLNPPTGGKVDALADWREMRSEFLLGDLGIIEKRLEKLQAQVKKPTPAKEKERDLKELELLERLQKELEADRPLSALSLSGDDEKLVTGFQFLTAKPKVVVANRGEAPLGAARLGEIEKGVGQPVFELAARNELEIQQLPPEDQAGFRREFGLEPGARDRVIQACYRAARLHSFFTAGEDEVRAWTIRLNDPAVIAAGKIHSDIARGFIRAETVAFSDYAACGSVKAAKERGLLRLEGKEYVVQDGDLIEFRHG